MVTAWYGEGQSKDFADADDAIRFGRVLESFEVSDENDYVIYQEFPAVRFV